AGLDLSAPLLERAARRHRGTGLALLALAELGDLAGAGIVLDPDELVAGLGRALQAEQLDRHRRPGRHDVLALVVDQRAHAAPAPAGHEDLADRQVAAPEQ